MLRLFAAIIVLTVVIGRPDDPDPLGRDAGVDPGAAQIDTLLNVMIVLSCFVFAIVIVMLGYCVWKYRAKPGDESDGEPIHGNTKLEIAWTVIPTVIVLFGAIYSWIVLGDIESKAVGRAARSTSPPSSTSGRFNYPQRERQGASSSNELVRAGRPPARPAPDARSTCSTPSGSPSGGSSATWSRAGPGGNDIDNTRRRDPRQGRDLQRGLHGALRLRARDDARPGAGRSRTTQFESWLRTQPEVEAGTGSPTGSSPGPQGVAATARATGAAVVIRIALPTGGRTW